MNNEFLYNTEVCKEVESGGGGHGVADEGEFRPKMVSSGASCLERGFKAAAAKFEDDFTVCKLRGLAAVVGVINL